MHGDEQWHSVVVDGEWVIGGQAAPHHVPPDWPARPQQQVHLDVHADDLEEAHELTLALVGRQLPLPQRPADNPVGDEFYAVYASPAGQLLTALLPAGVRGLVRSASSVCTPWRPHRCSDSLSGRPHTPARSPDSSMTAAKA